MSTLSFESIDDLVIPKNKKELRFRNAESEVRVSGKFSVPKSTIKGESKRSGKFVVPKSEFSVSKTEAKKFVVPRSSFKTEPIRRPVQSENPSLKEYYPKEMEDRGVMAIRYIGTDMFKRNISVPTSNAAIYAPLDVKKIEPVREELLSATMSRAYLAILKSDSIINISSSVQKASAIMKNKLIKLPSIGNLYVYQDMLDIYENNQAYYLDAFEECSIGYSDIVDGVVALEKWFNTIKEPSPKDKNEISEWKSREKSRLSGLSGYCDPRLAEHINQSK